MHTITTTIFIIALIGSIHFFIKVYIDEREQVKETNDKIKDNQSVIDTKLKGGKWREQ